MAKQKLAQAQLTAEIAKKRREVEEAKRKLAIVQKQTDRDNRKAEQEKARYENYAISKSKQKTNTVTGKCKVTTASGRAPELELIRENMVFPSEDELDEVITNRKINIKDMNPLRRARKLWTGIDGSNNPNLQGADNGANACLDMQLNEDKIDRETKYQSRYAKRNSDMGRCYDIDDIPIRGPPNTEEFPSDMSLDEITRIAKNLMEDDNISICRTTGIMRSKGSTGGREKRRVASTMVRPPQG